jgi:phage-related protein
MQLLDRIGRNMMDEIKIDKNRSKKEEQLVEAAIREVAGNMQMISNMEYHIKDAGKNMMIISELFEMCQRHPLAEVPRSDVI